MRQTKRKKRRALFKYARVCVLMLTIMLNVRAQTLPPWEESPNLHSQEQPSEIYYNENLRSGPPTGPGGSEEGGNSGTGTIPLGDGTIPIIAISFLYLCYKKKQLSRINNIR